MTKTKTAPVKSSSGVPRTPTTTKANLIMPPSRVSPYLVDRKAGMAARIMFAGGLESILSEVLNHVRLQLTATKRHHGTPKMIRVAIGRIPGLATALGDGFIAQSGWDLTNQFGVGTSRRTVQAV